MIFRQLFDPGSSTYTYLLADPRTRKAVLIDPVWEQLTRDAALIRELGLELCYTLETHVHADHVTAAWRFKEKLGSKVVLSKRAGTTCADVLVDDGDTIALGDLSLEVRATPGHTAGCVTYVTGDRTMAFTGDALLVRGAGRTDFQQGDARTLYRSVREKIFTLPDDCLVYPAHDYNGRTASSVGEEKVHNPRLGGTRSEDDFAGFMNNLGLPHPKQMDVAVPANLECGRPKTEPPPEATWGPVVRSYAGVPTIEPEWVAEHLGELTVLDVREADEYASGHVAGSRLVPLGDLRARLGEIPRDRPIVVFCRSGGRSAQAALILEKSGATHVANVSGGILEWQDRGLPLAR